MALLSAEPGVPVDLTVKNLDRRGLTLSWQAPLSDGGSPITGYIIEKARGTSARWIKVCQALNTVTK